MCAVSAIGDIWSDRFKQTPWVVPHSPGPGLPGIRPQVPENGTTFRLGELERQIQELKALVQQMHNELREAKAQDIAEGNPDCEMEDKVAVLKRVAEMVGVDLGDVFPNDN